MHFIGIHSLFLLWSWTHITLPFIKTLDSWLFHITKIYTSEYNAKKSKDKITIHYITFLILQKIHTTIWIWKSLQKFVFLYFIENSTKITTTFHVLLKWNQNSKIKSMVYQKQNLWFATIKYLQLSYFLKIVCVQITLFP